MQDRIDLVEVRIVKDTRFDNTAENMLRSELQAIFGDGIDIHLSYVAILDQTSSGKYRFSICNI